VQLCKFEGRAELATRIIGLLNFVPLENTFLANDSRWVET
jgi:hypothetical protein